MEIVVQLLSTVGFPITMCLIMGYYLKYTHDDHREDIKRLQEQQQQQNQMYADQMTQIIEAVNNNTKAMERIFDLQQYQIEDINNE